MNKNLQMKSNENDNIRSKMYQSIELSRAATSWWTSDSIHKKGKQQYPSMKG